MLRKWLNGIQIQLFLPIKTSLNQVSSSHQHSAQCPKGSFGLMQTFLLVRDLTNHMQLQNIESQAQAG